MRSFLLPILALFTITSLACADDVTEIYQSGDNNIARVTQVDNLSWYARVDHSGNGNNSEILMEPSPGEPALGGSIVLLTIAGNNVISSQIARGNGHLLEAVLGGNGANLTQVCELDTNEAHVEDAVGSNSNVFNQNLVGAFNYAKATASGMGINISQELVGEGNSSNVETAGNLITVNINVYGSYNYLGDNLTPGVTVNADNVNVSISIVGDDNILPAVEIFDDNTTININL